MGLAIWKGVEAYLLGAPPLGPVDLTVELHQGAHADLSFLLSDLSFKWMAGPLRAGKSCWGEGRAIERWNRWSEFYKAPHSRVVLKFLRTRSVGALWHYILPLSVRWRLYSWRAPTNDFKENLHLQTLPVPGDWRQMPVRHTPNRYLVRSLLFFNIFISSIPAWPVNSICCFWNAGVPTRLF